MPTFNKTKRNFTVSFITSLGLVALLLYYIMVYVPRNQERIDARNFRVLSRIGDNLHHSIQASVTGLMKLTKDAKDKDTTTLNERYLASIYKTKSLNKTIDNLEKASKIDGAVHLYQNTNEDFTHTVNHLSEDESSHNVSTNSYEIHFKAGGYHYPISINRVLSPLLRPDVFQEFYLFKSPSGAIDASALNTNRIIYSTSLINVHFFRPPATANTPKKASENTFKKASAGNILDIDIAGQAYKLFVIQQEVGYGQNWVLCGAVPATEYNRKRMAIPNEAIGFVLVGLILLMLSLPFIKLGLISSKEHLNLRDLILSFLALYMGACILIILWLNGTAYWRLDKETRETQLKELATSVETGFRQEITNILNQITELDEVASTINDAIYFKGEKYSVSWKKNYSSKVPNENQAGKNLMTNCYPFFTRLSWINKDGIQISTYSKDNIPNPLIDVKDRPYIRKLADEAGWQIKGREDTFYLNPHKSWLDGENYVTISQKSRNKGVLKKAGATYITMTTKLVSLTQAIVPPHFGFLIIDEEGEVLFHSNNKLDLNENFLQETDNNFHVKAALYNKLDHSFEEFYQGSKKNMYINHLPDLPLYVVAFVDKEHVKFRYLNNFVLSNSLFLFYFAIIAGLLTVLLLIAVQPTKIAFHQLSLTWLRPQQHYNQTYKKLSFFLLISIVYITLSFESYTSDVIFFMLLLVPFYFFNFAYYKLNGVTIKTIKENVFIRRILTAMILVLVFLNGAAIFAEILLYNNNKDAFSTYLPVLLFQLFLLSCWYLITNVPHNIFENLRPVFQILKNNAFYNLSINVKPLFRIQIKFEYYYFILILLLICLTSTLPAIIFYRDAYNRESEMLLQYHQLYLDNAIEKNEQNHPLDPGNEKERDPERFVKSKSRIYANFFYNTTHLHDDSSPQNNKKEVNAVFIPKSRNENLKLLKSFSSTSMIKSGKEKNVSASLFATIGDSIIECIRWLESIFTIKAPAVNKGKVIRLFFNKICPIIHQVIGTSNSENRLVCLTEPEEQKRFIYEPNSLLYLKQRDNLAAKEGNANSTVNVAHKGHFVSLIPYFSFNLLPHFWFNVAFFLLLLFLLIKFLIRRIFNIKFTTNIKLSKVDEDVLKCFSFQKILLVALPGTFEDNLNRFKKLVPNFDDYTLATIHLANEDNIIEPILVRAKNKTIVWVTDFDYLNLQKELVIKKLKLLKFFKQNNYAKIILQTSEHPSVWEEKWKHKELPADIENEMRQLLDMLSEYWKVFLPLQLEVENTFKGVEAQTGQTKEQTDNFHKEYDYEESILRQLVLAECKGCPFLKLLQPLLLEYIELYYKERMLNKSDIILKIQNVAESYYRMLWSACTKEEQSMLLDMAQDGIINARNIGVLTSLLSKGLLVKDKNQIVQLFNQSFQNFILTVISPEEVLQFKKDKKQNSRWEIYKVPLFIILIGVAAFIFITQQETWVTVIALLTGVSTLLNLLPRFGFLMPALFLSKESK